ncbi:SET domain-containing protein [Aspergillus ruber CBS 135680]|uniref:Ribosomal N-lysine methyltransferase n=1 Tax=Aspergillus ruber (strain CBS 135680) TaxID=1388766 RepID=A0A017SNB3_ASPRC|nr:ribosomal N-lysine methyltransferase [Aspergillus ruber CBS 135680]EYE98074.1 ribosomal N-lysine methyltransferase [Aspergillus ruber CBS 135680]
MTADDLPNEHIECMQWAISHGAEVRGVTPARFPGRGLGMVATRTIKEDETIITIPSSVMLTVDSVPSTFVKKFRTGTPTQAILAAYLTRGDRRSLKKWDPWRKVWPSRQVFEDSMPLLWPEFSQNNSGAGGIILPPSASGTLKTAQANSLGECDKEIYQNILSRQRMRLQHSWEDVVSVIPDMDWDSFSYNWCIVNTRSFYYVGPGKEDPEDWNDALGLVPFVDYFNHSDEWTCDVTFKCTNYIFKANRRIEKDEEIYISYGAHTNDFLLIEYGFFLDQNVCDAVYLDNIICRELSPVDEEELKQRDYYGNYEITPTGSCRRLGAVACMKYMDRNDWRSMMDSNSNKGIDIQKTAKAISDWINAYLKECETSIESLETNIAAEQDERRSARVSMILNRWKQIKSLCEGALDAVAWEDTDTE